MGAHFWPVLPEVGFLTALTQTLRSQVQVERWKSGACSAASSAQDEMGFSPGRAIPAQMPYTPVIP